jgi:hypothetical protein
MKNDGPMPFSSATRLSRRGLSRTGKQSVEDIVSRFGFDMVR